MIRWFCNKYVDPPYGRTEIYAGPVAFCSLASNGEYTHRTDRRTEGHQTVAFGFPARVIIYIDLYLVLCDYIL